MLKRVFWSRLEMHYFILQKSSFLQYFFALGRRGLQLLSSKFWWRLNLGGYLINDQTPWLGFLNPCLTKNMTTYYDIISNDRLSGSSAHFFSVRSFNPQARRTQKKKLGHSGESFPPCSRFLHSQPAWHNDLHEESMRKGLVGIFSRFLGCWQAICAQSANTLHSHGWVFQAVDSLSNQAPTLPNFETAHLIGIALSLLENTIRDGGSTTTLNAKHSST